MKGFPITTAQAPQYTGALPEAVDLVVIGGGIIGICTALYAARGGARVVVLEKGLVAAEQSSRNWGWIRQQGRDPAEMPIMDEAQRLWQDLSRETNEDIGLVQAGVTYLAYTESRQRSFEKWLPHGKAQGLNSKLLGKWISEIFSDDPAEWSRIRQAACNLGDVARSGGYAARGAAHRL